ncbi:MAG: Ig-like domain-containing protein [Ignavibacteriales bacterium]|nr:Ig-like domain-containing protein [Ignavibacteriales bacterium]
MKLIIGIFSATILFMSCVPEEEAKSNINYSSLKIQPEVDSVFLRANGESRQFSIMGSIVSVSERTIKNSGVMTDAEFTVRQIDTTYQSVDASSAEWVSTNSSVASVSNGLVTARSPGYAAISAVIGTTSSQSIVVNVRPVDTAPGLSLDPPYNVIQFENFSSMSGVVQQNAVLSVTEPNSGFSNANVAYSSDGTFNMTVTGLNPGVRTITVRATHPTNSALFTERYKTVAYYQPGTPAANAIVGDWLGTTLGKNFDFTISNSIIPTRYDINGTIEIHFEGIGTVQGIQLTGIINPNGTIDVTLAKSHNGFSISGKLNGSFKTLGTGEGEYSAKAEKSGWPKISFNEKWTAVKK